MIGTVMAGFLEEYKFPLEVRRRLLKVFHNGLLAERIVAFAERQVAKDIFVRKMENGEPGSASELRKELEMLAKAFDEVSRRCENISHAAAASIHGQGGAHGAQFAEISKYFLEQSGAASRAASRLPKKRGRERTSNLYLDTLVSLVQAHEAIFGLQIKKSRGTAGYELAQETLRAGGKEVEGAQLERMIGTAIQKFAGNTTPRQIASK